MNTDDDLVRMANQISEGFAAYPAEEALRFMVRHLKDFWPVPLRDRLRRLAAQPDQRLTTLAKRAADQL